LKAELRTDPGLTDSFVDGATIYGADGPQLISFLDVVPFDEYVKGLPSVFDVVAATIANPDGIGAAYPARCS
jgi:hypothetical protein